MAEKTITEFEGYKDNLETRFIEGLPSVEKKLYKDLLDAIRSSNLVKGKFLNDEQTKALIRKLPKLIRDSFISSDYLTSAEKYVLNFPKINEYIKEIHNDINGIKVKQPDITNIQKAEIGFTLENMTGSGMDANFVNPLKESLYRHIVAGGNITGAEQILQDFILSDKEKNSRLSRYVGQVARDGISQYEGAIQNKIANDYGMTKIKYVGSLIRDSRKQCRRWVEKSELNFDDLQKEINWAYSNGSGMIPGTTPENFIINRGGYNCRHTAIPTL